MAELKRFRLLAPTAGSNLDCDTQTPPSVFTYTAPATGMKIKKIVRNIVGADGLIGEYGFWLARGPLPLTAEKVFWDDGETVYQNMPMVMPTKTFDLGEHEISIGPNEMIVYQVQGQLLARMRTIGNYPEPQSHRFIPEIILWYVEP